MYSPFPSEAKLRWVQKMLSIFLVSQEKGLYDTRKTFQVFLYKKIFDFPCIPKRGVRFAFGSSAHRNLYIATLLSLISVWMSAYEKMQCIFPSQKLAIIVACEFLLIWNRKWDIISTCGNCGKSQSRTLELLPGGIGWLN